MTISDKELRICLLVLGMHRSGTSAFTRVLSLLGADLPKRLFTGTVGNEKGHWESRNIIDLNEDLLVSGGSYGADWSRFNEQWYRTGELSRFKARALAILSAEFSESRLFVIKEPRICRFIPFWKTVLDEFGAETRVVLPIRNPMDVVLSLRTRDGAPSSEPYLLWLRHVLDAEYESRGLPRAIVSFEGLMEDWRATAGTIAERLDIAWPRWSPRTEFEISEFLEARLKHHDTPAAKTFSRRDIPPWVREAYGALETLGADPTDQSATGTLDRVRAAFDEACIVFAPATHAALAFATAKNREAADAVRLLTAQEAAHAEEIHGLNADITNRAELVEALEKDLSSACEQVQRLQQVIAARDSEMATARDVAQSLGAELDSLRLHAEELTAAATHERDRHGVETRSLQEKIDVLEDSIRESSAQLDAKNVELKELRANLAFSRQEVERERDEHRSRLRSSVSENGNLRAKIEKVKRKPKKRWRVTRPLRATSGLAQKGFWKRSVRLVARPLCGPVKNLALSRRGARKLAWFLPKNERKLVKTVWRLRRSGLFDVEWYRQKYLDIAKSKKDPVVHYVTLGAKKGFDPGPDFNTNIYLSQNPHLLSVDVNPLFHYLKHSSHVSAEPCASQGNAKALPTQHPEAAAVQSVAPSVVRGADAEARRVRRVQRLLPISVVIPTFNRGSLLEITLEKCIANSGGVEIEFVVINDGSSDHTAEIIKSLALKVPNIVTRTIPNSGPGHARNLGASIASHDVILFLGDDIQPLNEDFFLTHSCLHADYPSTAFAVLGKVVWPDNPSEHVNFVMSHIQGRDGEQFGYASFEPYTFLDWRFFYTCNVSVKKSLVRDWITEGFSDKFTLYGFEDIEFAYRVSKKLEHFAVFYDPRSIGCHIHSYSVNGFINRQVSAGMMAEVFIEMHPELSEQLGIKELQRLISLPTHDRDERFVGEYLTLVEGIKAWARLLDQKRVLGREAWHEDLLSAVFELCYNEGFVLAQNKTMVNFIASYEYMLSRFIRRMRAVIGSELTADRFMQRRFEPLLGKSLS